MVATRDPGFKTGSLGTKSKPKIVKRDTFILKLFLLFSKQNPNNGDCYSVSPINHQSRVGRFSIRDNFESISLQIENKTLASCTISLNSKIMFLITVTVMVC